MSNQRAAWQELGGDELAGLEAEGCLTSILTLTASAGHGKESRSLKHGGLSRRKLHLEGFTHHEVVCVFLFLGSTTKHRLPRTPRPTPTS